jgi:hypothetical protein
MKRYPSEHPGSHTGPGRCVALLERSGAQPGVVLDLGCGRAPLADQVRELGLEYVGADVDASAVAEVSERGFEAHRLDLGADARQLSGALGEIVAGRAISAVLMVDVLEHLIEPAEILTAIRGLAGGGESFSLIVSVPHIAHFDIAAKLLMGRWDLTEFGLLDDTHLRFFSERLFAGLFEATGWSLAEADDVISPLSDQLFPADAPTLRPGTPASELLRRLSARSHPHSRTFQFVRRFVPAATAAEGPHSWRVKPESDEERIFASVIVDAAEPARADLLADLEAQSSTDFETIVVEPDPNDDPRNAAIAAAEGRYLCFLEEGVRVSPNWIEAFRRHPELAGHVLRADAAAERLGGEPLPPNHLDLLHHGRPGPVVLAAFAVPIEAARTAGLRFESERGEAATSLFLHRAAELCGVVPVEVATVAASTGAMRDGEADLAAVAAALDERPLIMPAASASRIVELRRALTATQESLSWRVTKPLRGLKRIGGGGQS